MIFSIAVSGSPQATEAPRSALAFARAAAARGHSIHRVFFYGDGVAIASSIGANNKDTLARDWLSFAEASQTELAVCVAAAERRGIAPADSAEEGAAAFNFVGLGQLAEAAIVSDRVLTFPA